MVGVLAAVGRGDLEASDAARLIEAKSAGSAAALTAPAAGLFLERVMYKGDPAPPPIAPVILITG